MSIKAPDSFAAFAALNRYFALIESTKPTLKQAEEAMIFLCQIYGANNEEELIQRGDTAIIETYNELKYEILKVVTAE
jgi:hypothetical protein